MNPRYAPSSPQYRNRRARAAILAGSGLVFLAGCSEAPRPHEEPVRPDTSPSIPGGQAGEAQKIPMH